MANFTITTSNRSAARRMLNAWHDSRAVRVMTLAQLQAALQRACNEGLITEQGAIRALQKKQALKNENPHHGGKHDLGHDEDMQELDEEIGAHAAQGDNYAAEEQDGNGDGEAQANGDGAAEESWDDQLDDASGDGDGEDGDGEDDAESCGDQSEDGEDGDEDDSEDESEDGTGDGNEDEDDAEQEEQDRDESEKDDKQDRDEDKQEDGEQDEDGEQEDGDGDAEQEQEQQQEQEQEDEEPRKKHKMFPVILKYIKAGLNVALVGPAGTGKSTIAMQLAEELALEFRSTGALMSKYDLVGYKDATGQYHETPLYESFTRGCLFCFDELDGSSPDAVVSFNAVTDNQGCFAFPNGMQYKHERFVAVACLNTWGNGATADYVGRFKQDAASMSRFVRVFIDYDKAIEKTLGPVDIVNRVWALREACDTLGIRHIVSTRMIVFASKARDAGVTRREIDRDILFAGLDDAAITQVKAQMKMAAKS